MPSTLYLLTTAEGLESEVQDSLLAEPEVAASQVLFKNHVVARVRDDADATRLQDRIEGVRRIASYSSA